MKSIIKTLMKRDGMTESEAREYAEEEMREVMDMIGAGDFGGAEEYFSSVFGLEPDYLLNAIL